MESSVSCNGERVVQKIYWHKQRKWIKRLTYETSKMNHE